MARIKIDMPSRYCFNTKYTVSIGDINYGGHLSNDAVLRIVHNARIEFLEKKLMTEFKIGKNGLIMSDAVIQYLSEAFRGDELTIQIAIDNITKLGFDLFYLLKNRNAKVVAKIKTGMLFFDYNLHKISAEAEDTLTKLEAFNK